MNRSIVAHLYALQCFHISASFRTRLYPSHLHFIASLSPLPPRPVLHRAFPLFRHLRACRAERPICAGGQAKGAHEAGDTYPSDDAKWSSLLRLPPSLSLFSFLRSNVDTHSSPLPLSCGRNIISYSFPVPLMHLSYATDPLLHPPYDRYT